HEVAAVIGAAANNDVNVRMLRVPMVDRDPVELGPEVTLRLRHQVPGKCLEIRQLSGVIRRHDEPKMMPITLAAFRKGAMVGVVMLGVEHPSRGAVLGDPFPLEIVEMRAERCALDAVPDHARLDDDTACPVGQKAACCQACRAAAPKRAAASARASGLRQATRLL